ncbi:MAG: hypothetical protein KDC14_10075 [Planctomycetes bacterium]|nr:hypothetical protein [Planctomycetota bacterium]
MKTSLQANQPGCSPRDPLTRGLLPVVIHQLNNATQLLANFQALLTLGDADEILRQRSGDIADTARSVHELGYVLAVIASASGADLLLERREARGLEWMLQTVRDGLRREGRDLAAPSTPLPDLRAAVGEGWELSWALGALLYVAGRTAPAELPVAWRLEPAENGWRFQLDGITADELGGLWALAVERLPGATPVEDGGRVALELPADWLRAADPPADRPALES